jgi:hypothetical protein
MAEYTDTIFPHRRNPDGSFDSICPWCFLTVSAKRNETELAGDEKNHNCYGLATQRNKAGTSPVGPSCPLRDRGEWLAVLRTPAR